MTSQSPRPRGGAMKDMACVSACGVGKYLNQCAFDGCGGDATGAMRRGMLQPTV
jgi:hypothetical protein